MLSGGLPLFDHTSFSFSGHYLHVKPHVIGENQTKIEEHLVARLITKETFAPVSVPENPCRMRIFAHGIALQAAEGALSFKVK